MESRICFFAAVLISLLFCGTATLFAEDASKRNATSASKQNHAQTTAEVGGGGENAAAEAAEAADDEEENPAFVGNPLTPEESWQILSWEEKNPGAVLKYEVVVESASAHEELRRMETKRSETSIHVFPLLPPGRYRYKVVTYDLVGSPAAESDWTNITIYAAHQPEISSIKSTLKHSSTIYLDEINDELKEKYDLVPRFSCGYGELTLALQADIFKALPCEKTLGITLNSSFLMTPTKSVTAIIGIRYEKE